MARRHPAPLSPPGVVVSLKASFEASRSAGCVSEADDVVKLGARLRDLRQQRGLTIRSLAERSGLAINTLSMIENGKTSPSVSTLQQLARALELPITAFFEEKTVARQVVYVRRLERPSVAMGTNRLEHLGKDLAGDALQPFVVTLEIGAGSGLRPIVHTGHEFVYCLSGKVLYTIDEQAYLLEEGDSLVFESHLPHRWQNLGFGPSQILLVMAPSDLRDVPAERHFPPKRLRRGTNEDCIDHG